MNILLLYNATQTFTNTVFEHLNSFRRFSQNRIFYCHSDQTQIINVDFNLFDVVIVHYTIRLPFNQLNETTADLISDFTGLKVLFIQDEYDHTHNTWAWIKRLGMDLVFTVVPQKNIERIYPRGEFPTTRFVNNLTGYIPLELPSVENLKLPSQRECVIGYRGRPLPIKYGQLGLEKVTVGRLAKEFCKKKHILHDIEWSEASRIYGPAWYEFMASCRSMLGSESGSNVFDWDGTLSLQITTFKQQKPAASDDEIYYAVVEQYDQHGLMNQISPRVFESIALHTVLVLFEGDYSGVLTPGVHFIPLKKDGSNLDDVFKLLDDTAFVDEMATRAYGDIILSGKYSYQSFVNMVDDELSSFVKKTADSLPSTKSENIFTPSLLTTYPLRALSPREALQKSGLLKRNVYRVWALIPEKTRKSLKPLLNKLWNKE